MNPSTADMLDAIEKVNAETVYILPNNKNIILAAEQATHMVENKKIVVIPTKTVPQGITAVINYVPDLSVRENTDTMMEEIRDALDAGEFAAYKKRKLDGFAAAENRSKGHCV